MTTLTLDLERGGVRERRGVARPGAGRAIPRRGESAERRSTNRSGGEVTLDDVVVGAWEGLLANHTVSCPVCSGALAPRYGAGSAPVGGRCTDCGSTLG
jgi:hypothetical protein